MFRWRDEKWNRIKTGHGDLRADGAHYDSIVLFRGKTAVYGLPSGKWYCNDVKGSWETGLINGLEDDTLRPDESMTFAQAMKLAACMNQMYTIEEDPLLWIDKINNQTDNN